MKPGNTFRKRKAFLLLLTCICFFIAGITVLTLGAVIHVNPKITFAGLFKLQPFINLVYTFVP
jgi:hypothetical protein